MFEMSVTVTVVADICLWPPAWSHVDSQGRPCLPVCSYREQNPPGPSVPGSRLDGVELLTLSLPSPPLITPTSTVKSRACFSVRGHVCVLTDAPWKRDLCILSSQHLKNHILFSSPESREGEGACRRMSGQQPPLEQKVLCQSHFKL